jgi:hypothetical protein
METLAAIVVALAILTAIFLGIILVSALFVFLVSFLSARVAAWWDSAAGSQARSSYRLRVLSPRPCDAGSPDLMARWA